MSHFRDPISRLGAGPTCSLAIHRTARSYNPIPRRHRHRRPSPPPLPSPLPPIPFLPDSEPGAAGTPPPNGTLELLPNPLSFPVCIGILCSRYVLSFTLSLMCALESGWKGEGETPAGETVNEGERAGEGERGDFISRRPTRRLSRFRTSAKCIAASLCEPNCNGSGWICAKDARRTSRRGAGKEE